MAMSPDTHSYYTFFETLCEIERLVATRAKMIDAYVDVCSIGKIIMQKTDILITSNVVVSKAHCLISIERLAEASLKIREGTHILKDGMEQTRDRVECHLLGGNVLRKIMELKLDALIKMAASDMESDRFYLSDRLAELARKMMDFKIHSVISAKCCTLMKLSESGPSRSARGASQSSEEEEEEDDDDDVVVVLTPDESDSASSIVSTGETSSEEQVRGLQDSLQKPDTDKTNMSLEITNRNDRIHQLETEIAGYKTHGGEGLVTAVSELATMLAAAERIKKDQAITIEDFVSTNSHLSDDNCRLRNELKAARKALGQLETSARNTTIPLPPPKSDSNFKEQALGEPLAEHPPCPAEKAMPIDPEWQRPTSYSSLPKRIFTRSRESAGTRAYTFGKPNGNYRWPGFDGPTTLTAKAIPEADKPELWGDHSSSDCDTWDW